MSNFENGSDNSSDFFANLETISFAEWLIELNAEAVNIGFAREPIVQVTALLCWFVDYEAGLTPQQVLAEAISDGEEFGEDYTD
jgi:hypothetical protein